MNRKNNAEAKFWSDTIIQYIKWYSGEVKTLYGEPSPKKSQKIIVNNIKDSAILTWEKIHQQQKYLEDLQISKDAYKNKIVLDIGSGPHPSARVFKDTQLYCLDPLLDRYISIGFPIHYYNNVKFIQAYSEDIPLQDNTVDIVISVNALDHVNDLDKTSREIKRVLKKDGLLRFHLHYHNKTREEPIELNDQIVRRTFNWCKNFHKLSESNMKRGYTLSAKEGIFSVWTNMDK